MRRVYSLAFEEDEDEFVLRRPRWIREREEHFDTLDDHDFVTRFQLTKPTVLSLLEAIEDKLEFSTNIFKTQSVSRRRPVLNQSQALTQQRVDALLSASRQANEQHEAQMRILKLQEEREIEILKQERLRTEQEQLRVMILKEELKKLQ